MQTGFRYLHTTVEWKCSVPFPQYCCCQVHISLKHVCGHENATPFYNPLLFFIEEAITKDFVANTAVVFFSMLIPWGATEVVSIIILSIVVSLQSSLINFLMKLLWHLPNCFSYTIMFECVVHNHCCEFWQLLQARYGFSMQISADWNFLQPFYIAHISRNRGRVCVSMQWPCSSRVWLSSTKA